MIFRCLILIPRLDGMMTVAERLPVIFIPEESLVSSVRNDVINVRCLDVLAFLHALHAERVSLKVTLTCSLPCLAVASPCCRAYLFRVLRLVQLTVLLPVGNEGSAAWVTAGRVRS